MGIIVGNEVKGKIAGVSQSHKSLVDKTTKSKIVVAKGYSAKTSPFPETPFGSSPQYGVNKVYDPPKTSSRATILEPPGEKKPGLFSNLFSRKKPKVEVAAGNYSPKTSPFPESPFGESPLQRLEGKVYNPPKTSSRAVDLSHLKPSEKATAPNKIIRGREPYSPKTDFPNAGKDVKGADLSGPSDWYEKSPSSKAKLLGSDAAEKAAKKGALSTGMEAAGKVLANPYFNKAVKIGGGAGAVAGFLMDPGNLSDAAYVKIGGKEVAKGSPAYYDALKKVATQKLGPGWQEISKASPDGGSDIYLTRTLYDKDGSVNGKQTINLQTMKATTEGSGYAVKPTSNYGAMPATQGMPTQNTQKEASNAKKDEHKGNTQTDTNHARQVSAGQAPAAPVNHAAGTPSASGSRQVDTPATRKQAQSGANPNAPEPKKMGVLGDDEGHRYNVPASNTDKFNIAKNGDLLEKKADGSGWYVAQKDVMQHGSPAVAAAQARGEGMNAGSPKQIQPYVNSGATVGNNSSLAKSNFQPYVNTGASVERPPLHGGPAVVSTVKATAKVDGEFLGPKATSYVPASESSVSIPSNGTNTATSGPATTTSSNFGNTPAPIPDWAKTSTPSTTPAATSTPNNFGNTPAPIPDWAKTSTPSTTPAAWVDPVRTSPNNVSAAAGLTGFGVDNGAAKSSGTPGPNVSRFGRPMEL